MKLDSCHFLSAYGKHGICWWTDVSRPRSKLKKDIEYLVVDEAHTCMELNKAAFITNSRCRYYSEGLNVQRTCHSKVTGYGIQTCFRFSFMNVNVLYKKKKSKKKGLIMKLQSIIVNYFQQLSQTARSQRVQPALNEPI